MLKKIFLVMFLAAPAMGDTGFADTIRVSEQDNTPACTVGQLKVSNGTLTCNGQVANITTGSGSSSLPFLSSTSTNTLSSADFEFTSSSNGPVFTDSSLCKWRVTITTAGNLVTTLLSCPTVVVARPCKVGMSRGLLLAITCSPND